MVKRYYPHPKVSRLQIGYLLRHGYISSFLTTDDYGDLVYVDAFKVVKYATGSN